MRSQLLRALPVLCLAVLVGCLPAPSTSSEPAQSGGARASYPPPLKADQHVSISFANYNVASAGVGKEATEELVGEFTGSIPT